MDGNGPPDQNVLPPAGRNENQEARPDPSRAVRASVEHRYEFAGPLPPAAELARYEQIQPGFADRIIIMAEAEQRHRHDIDSAVVRRTFDEARRGQIFGLAIGLAAIVTGGVTSVLGAQIPGGIIGGTGVVGLVAVFVIGRFRGTHTEQENDA